MTKSRFVSMVASVSLLGLGFATTARAGVPEELAAFKTAATELKTVMTSITDEATAKAKVGTLEAAITKFNAAGTTLDASLAKLDRTKEADATLYQNTQADMQSASQALADNQIRMIAAPPISAVVSTKLDTLRK